MNAPLRTWIVGDGGQARELAELVQTVAHDAAGRPLLLQGLLGLEQERALSAALASAGAHTEATGLVLGLGFPAPRLAAFERLGDQAILPVVIHPTAVLSPGTKLAPGVVVTAGCVVTTGVSIGAGSLLNPRSGIGHDTTLGRCCVINPGANLSGDVVLGDGVLVGSGATVLQGITVGAGARIGAGAVATKDVAAGSTVVGVPARPTAAGPRNQGAP